MISTPEAGYAPHERALITPLVIMHQVLPYGIRLHFGVMVSMFLPALHHPSTNG